MVKRFDHEGLPSSGTKLHLTKTFMVEMLYDCNLLCHMKCSTSLTFKAIAMNPYHIINIYQLRQHV